MSGLVWDRLTARAAVLGEAAAARRRAALVRALDGVPGVVVATEGDAVLLTGRGLMRRLTDDVRLRFAGRNGR